MRGAALGRLHNEWLSIITNMLVSVNISGIAAEMKYTKGVDAFLGPGCTEALDPVGRLAGFWNKPVVTGYYAFMVVG